VSTGSHHNQFCAGRPERDGEISNQAKPGPFLYVFRVRMDGLKPGTTYYYTVDSMEANCRCERQSRPGVAFWHLRE
jgi:hypothetical protein